MTINQISFLSLVQNFQFLFSISWLVRGVCLFVTSRQKKVHCFSDHLTCPIKNIKKGGIEGQGLESKQAGGKKHESRKREGKGWETLRGRAKVSSWRYWCLGWMCVGGGGRRVNPESRLKGQMRIGQRGLKRLHMTPLSREILESMPRFRRFYYVTMCVMKSFVLVPLSHLFPYPLYPTVPSCFDVPPFPGRRTFVITRRCL